MSQTITRSADERALFDKTTFGFWVYLMTDCLLFGSLFVTYAVLRNGTYGGPSGSDIFDMPYILVETMLLLTSSFTCGLAILALNRHRRGLVFAGLAVTFLLGAGFVGMELHEFAGLLADGNGWQRSGFLSAFFTLVGTHGLHVTIGLLWMIVMGWQLAQRGFKASVVRRLTLLSMFWHFLDVIWIFIFTTVYLLGDMKV